MPCLLIGTGGILRAKWLVVAGVRRVDHAAAHVKLVGDRAFGTNNSVERAGGQFCWVSCMTQSSADDRGRVAHAVSTACAHVDAWLKTGTISHH